MAEEVGTSFDQDQGIEEMFDSPEASGEEIEAAPDDGEPTEPSTDKPRDEKGRFVSQSKAEGEAEEEPEETEESDLEEPDAEEPEPTEEPTEPTEPEEEEAPPEAEAPTFSYQGDNREWEIPGSAVGQDGAFIPTEQLPHVKQLLASGRGFPRFQQQMQAQLQQAHQTASMAQTQLNTIISNIEGHIERGTLEEFLVEARERWPILKAEAEAAALRQKNEQDGQELQRLRHEQEDARDLPGMKMAVEETVLTMAREFGFGQSGQLTPAETQALGALYAQLTDDPMLMQQMFPRAPEDNPAFNVRKGQRIDNRASVVRQYLGMLRQVWGVRPQPAPPKQVAKAKATNAKALQEPKAPPKTVPAGRGPSPKQRPKAPTITTTREADEQYIDKMFD